jgi:hypothetical protein
MKNCDRDDGAPDNWYQKRPSNYKAPAYEASDHRDPDHGFDRAVDGYTIADGGFWICHGRAPERITING